MNQDRIQQINEEIVRLEAQKNEGVSLETTDRINAQIKSLEDERVGLEAEQQAAEQAEREKGKMDVFGNYVDSLSEMFEALFPSEAFRAIMGINEYEEKRAQYYQLNQAFVSETLDNQHQQNEAVLAAKDEKIKLLNEQSLSVQKQLDDARRKAEEAWKEIDELEARESKAAEEIEANEAKIRELEMLNQQTQTLLNTANERIADIQSKLDAAQQPKEEVKTSQKFADMVSQIKSINDTSADEMLARFNARQKSDDVKIEVPEAPQQQENPFRGEDGGDTSADSGSVPSVVPPQTVEGPTFPTAAAPDVQGVSAPMVEGQPTGQVENAPATQGWVREQIAELRKELMGKESQVA